MMSIFKTIICALILLYGIPIVSGQDNDEQKLETLKSELDAKRSEFDRLDEKEQDQLARLRRLEEQIAISGQLILKIERAVRKLEVNIRYSRAELDTSNVILEKKKEILLNRMRYIYEVGKRPGWAEILLSKNPTEMLAGISNMKAILEYDRHLVSSYNSLSDKIAAGIEKLNKDRTTLENLKSEYQEEFSKRKEALDSRKRLLEKLRKDKNVIAKSMDRLEEDTRSITGIFDNIQAEKEVSADSVEFPGLDDKKGDLIWPVYGKIIRQFGTIRDKRGIKLTNPGIDIKAPYGARIGAAAAGRVIYVSWLRGYGQFIIIDHGQNYYTLYANLGTVMVDTGDIVKADQTVALAGDSGTLEGSRLHFELRHGKDQLDPVDWLR